MVSSPTLAASDSRNSVDVVERGGEDHRIVVERGGVEFGEHVVDEFVQGRLRRGGDVVQ